MNLFKRWWLYYVEFDHIDRALIKAYDNKGREKQDEIMLQIIKNNKISRLQRFWWQFGIPLIIGFFSWGFISSAIENVPDWDLLIFLTAFISYFLGAVLKDQWNKNPATCLKCGKTLSVVCLECGRKGDTNAL